MIRMDSSSYVHRFRATMRALRPVPTLTSSTGEVLCHPALPTTTQVFVCRDASHKPLQPSYDGSFTVAHRSLKVYPLQLNDRQITVSIDRLKSAFVYLLRCSPSALINIDPVPSNLKITTSRSISWAQPLVRVMPRIIPGSHHPPVSLIGDTSPSLLGGRLELLL